MGGPEAAAQADDAPAPPGGGHEGVRSEDRWMPCADGVRLATRLWIPAGPGPWPVLLMRQPYGRAIASTVTYAHPRWYAGHGFLVAVQDVRGRGDSEGEFRGFAAEAADGAAAVRWARALPEGSGRVGTYGFSYQGLSQLLNSGEPAPDPAAETAAPETAAPSACDPLPDCLAPAMAGLDERRHWASEGGAHWWGLGLAWALQLAAEGCRRRGDEAGWWAIRRCLEAGLHGHEGLALLERHDPDGMGLRWLRLDPGSPAGWRRHGPPAELLRRPMLLIGGWHDPHLEGVLDLWQRASQAGGQPALVVGPWTHLDWGDGLDALQLAFFRRHLLPPGRDGGGGADGGIVNTDESTSLGHACRGPGGNDPALELPPPLVGSASGGIALAGEGPTGWFTPRPGEGPVEVVQDPSGAPPPVWHLHSDGRAAACGSEGRLIAESDQHAGAPNGVVVLVHDPWRPVPARGGHLDLPPGVLERADLDRRGDVACFTTAPLERELLLVGRPVLQLQARADQPGFDLCGALSWLPAGSERVLQISSGVLRQLGEGALQLAPRRLELQPLALKLAPGDRLRLAIAASAWPAIAVNPGDGTIPRGPAGPQHRLITLELACGEARLALEPLLSREPGAD